MVKIFSGLFRHLNFVISEHPCPSVNRADGISEIEGKAATGSGERAGKQASFKSVVVFLYLCPFVPIHG